MVRNLLVMAEEGVDEAEARGGNENCSSSAEWRAYGAAVC